MGCSLVLSQKSHCILRRHDKECHNKQTNNDEDGQAKLQPAIYGLFLQFLAKHSDMSCISLFELFFSNVLCQVFILFLIIISFSFEIIITSLPLSFFSLWTLLYTHPCSLQIHGCFFFPLSIVIYIYNDKFHSGQLQRKSPGVKQFSLWSWPCFSNVLSLECLVSKQPLQHFTYVYLKLNTIKS